MPTWNLEYMLLFGPPENKLELLDGQTPCSFPFVDRESADAHFALWSATLARWQDVADPPARMADEAWVKEFGRFKLKQYRRPLRLEVPSQIDAYHWAHSCFFDRRLWPMQPAGFEKGYGDIQEHWQIKINLWKIFEDATERLGLEGSGLGGVDISLTETDAVAPDYFFFPGPRQQNMIAGQYFHGVPLLIMEVLSSFSRAIDRGPRKEIYRRAGVSQLWLIEPLTRSIELYLLENGEYRLDATIGSGESLPVPGMPGMTLAADDVFKVHSPDWFGTSADDDSPPDAYAIPRDKVVGLQHLLLLGHAERRREIWNNQTPCHLAFGSPEEARHRLAQFLVEAGRWEGISPPTPSEIEPGMAVADVGRFHFIRQGHIVRLNVDVSGLLYRELLAANANHAAWDWGDGD